MHGKPTTISMSTFAAKRGVQHERVTEDFRKGKPRQFRAIGTDGIALSIDDTKKSGSKIVGLPMTERLFEREIAVNLGPSMLKRFQMSGQTLDAHDVSDHLLLTYL